MKPEYDEDLTGFLVAFWGIIFPIGVFGIALFAFWGYQDVKDWVDRQREKTQIERNKKHYTRSSYSPVLQNVAVHCEMR